MAQHKSAIKRARQSLKRHTRNQQVRSRMRTLIKQFREAATSGDASAAEKLKAAESGIRKAASRGVIPKRRASRRVSRLARQLASASK